MSAQNDLGKIASLEPQPVWQRFAAMLAVPRPSKREEKIRAHIRQVAEQEKLKFHEDAVGNIFIRVPATPGHENAPITVLQGHLDMVCEKNADVDIDFDRDPIPAVVDRDDRGKSIVRSQGTTLGADNGIGVALALAAATAPGVVHGPLELLFTIDEEAGMTGAKALTPESFKGRRMLNLDSEEDNQIYIGCAGGCDTNLTWSFPGSAPAAEANLFEVVVSGLRGGHSGSDIHEGRGNAIKLLVRALSGTGETGLRLARLEGGSKRNAIPRDARAIVAGSPALQSRLEVCGRQVAEEARDESYEPNARIDVRPFTGRDAQLAITQADTARLLAGLGAIPSGVLGMHPRVPGLVETSNNVSTAETIVSGTSVRIVIGTLTRSSSGSRIREALAQIAAIGSLSGATVANANEYPGWSPNPDSPLLAVGKRVYQSVFGEEPEVAAIHAGLECGIIRERVGEIDVISFGPNITGAHSPAERVYVDSVQKIWKYLQAVLAELAKG